MNLGAFWAAIVCGAVGQSVGWWAGFGLGGLGMAAGLVVFVHRQSRWLAGPGRAARRRRGWPAPGGSGR